MSHPCHPKADVRPLWPVSGLRPHGIFAALLTCLLAVAALAETPVAPTKVPASRPAHVPVDLARETAEYRRILEALTDPGMEGRGSGAPGIDKARDWIAGEMKSMGLKPALGDSYIQPFEASLGLKVKEQSLTVLDKEGKVVLDGKAGTDFNTLGLSANGSFKDSVVFAGYGIVDPGRKYNSYAQANVRPVRGKAAIVFRYEPMDEKGKSVWAKGQAEWTEDSYIATKALQAAKNGATVLLLVDPPAFKTQLLTTRQTSSFVRSTIPVFSISQGFFGRMLAAATTNLPSPADLQKACDNGNGDLIDLSHIKLQGKCQLDAERAKLYNVMGVLPGVGDLAKQWVVVGGHYDHLGLKPSQASSAPSQADVRANIYTGADDNASGASGVILLARWMARQLGSDGPPRRTIVFVDFSGEELGLYGSQYMATHLGELKVGLDQVAAMLNFDMIGRMRGGKFWAMGTDSGERWKEILASVRPMLGSFLVPEGPVPGNSDHASFTAQRVPALHFFTGMHLDVHSPRDLPEKINCEGAVQVLDSAAQVLEECIYGRRMAFATGKVFGLPRATGSKPYLGVSLNTPDSGKGCVVDDVLADNPAYTGGVRKGDQITAWNDQPIECPDDVFTQMDTAKPGQKVTLTIIRDGKKQTLTVTLGSR